MEKLVQTESQTLLEALALVPDNRKRRGRRHPLSAILTMSVCAMLCGARSLYAIAQWGREHSELTETLGFTRTHTPCVSTLHYVFKELDVNAFERVLGEWAHQSLGKGKEIVALDGKALRGIHGEELPGVRLVAAYAQKADIVLAQKGGNDPT